ncbi:MAG: hypothetical protein E7012_03335 [Alphaproteobacteria bacterium]|nr:hypothetical protein [Alphaproteobacteria bacterium]
MNRKLFVSCLALGMATCIGWANAADDAILFKVHDIMPVKDADGRVTSCELGATFFNRSKGEVTNTELNLTWTDDVVVDAINQEERNARENKRANRKDVPRYSTASANSKDVVLNLRLPPLKANQQVTLKSKINTDRCFLLLNDLDVDVINCSSTIVNNGKKEIDKSACKELFRFVGPKSQEYYYEFKEISIDEAIIQDDNKIESKKNELNSLYEDTIKSLNNASKKLRDAMPNTDGAN